VATRTEILKRLHQIRQAGLRELSRVEDQAVQGIIRTALEATRNVQRLLDRADQGASALELLNSIDLLLSEATIRQERILNAGANGVLDVSLGMSIDQHTSFGLMTPRRILTLSQQFNAGFRADLRSEAYTRWIRRIPAETLAPESALRAALSRAVLEGKGSRVAIQEFMRASTFDKTFQTAGQFLRKDVAFKNLPMIEQKVTPLFRATRVIRTELGRLDNVAGITFDQAAGMEKFVNLGVGDERQSDICAEATEADPMTLAEWSASEFGIAPRHPFCRCAMFGVPPEVDSNLSILALGEIGAVNQELVEA